MKLLLTAICAAAFTTPLVFAEEGKCDKKCDGEKKDESTMVVPCDKCDKHKEDAKKEEAKKESTIIAGKDCDKCPGEKKEESESTLFAA